MSIVQDLIL